MDVRVTENHPFYHVWVDGQIVEVLFMRTGPALTWSQQDSIADGYKEWYDGPDKEL